MATAQFLVRNRHQNIWYGRVMIPSSIRSLFQGKKEPEPQTPSAFDKTVEMYLEKLRVQGRKGKRLS